MKAFPVSLSPEDVSIRDYSDGHPHTDRQVGPLSLHKASFLSVDAIFFVEGTLGGGGGAGGGAAKKGPDSLALKDRAIEVVGHCDP